MEIRINKHGPDSLATKAFFSDESGFEVASVIVMGKTDAALIDTQWSLSNGHRVAAEIFETGKQLKWIYISHAHPDHYFGLEPIMEAFPEAKVIALPVVASTIHKQMFGKVGYWKNIIGPTNYPTKAVKIESLVTIPWRSKSYIARDTPEEESRDTPISSSVVTPSAGSACIRSSTIARSWPR